MDLRSLKQKRNAVVQEMRGLVADAEVETRDLSDSENEKFENLKKEERSLTGQIERAEAIHDAESRMESRGSQSRDSFESRSSEFSIIRAINGMIDPGSVDDGLERELSAEIGRRSGRGAKGRFVPHEVFLERRSVTTGGTGAHLVPETHRGDLMIDTLRERLLLKKLGCTVLDGLIGDIDIPRLTGSATAYHIDEHSTDVTGSDHTFDSVEMSATTVGALVEYSRRMLLNAVPAVERLVRSDLAKVIAGEIDKQALVGTGLGNYPTGVKNTSGVNTVTFGGAPTWAKVLDFETALSVDKALADSLAWVGNPYCSSKMRSVLKESSGGTGFIMENPNTLAGYPFHASNHLDGNAVSSPVEAGDLFFGNWSDLLLGYWGAVDILPNPYETNVYKKGGVLILALQDYDVDVRHPESFCIATDMTV